jgi:PAS domain S-box-containing protein
MDHGSTPTTDALSRAMRVGERELREIIDATPAMIWRTGVDKLRDYCNIRWLEWVGRPLEAEVGAGWAEHLHPDDRARWFETFSAAFEARSPFVLICRMRRNDGAYRRIRDSGAPYERDGRFAGFLGASIDVTEDAPEEDALRRDLAEQEQLMAELRHRAKNNLQLIVGLLALQARTAASPEAAAALREAGARVRALGAVQELLHDSVHGAAADLAGYLPEVARRVIAAEGAESARLELDADPLDVPAARALSLGLIVNELVADALRHAHDGASIKVSVHEGEGARGEVVLWAEGASFAESASERGGLSVVRALARQAGGDVKFEDRGGAWACLSFPLG